MRSMGILGPFKFCGFSAQPSECLPNWLFSVSHKLPRVCSQCKPQFATCVLHNDTRTSCVRSVSLPKCQSSLFHSTTLADYKSTSHFMDKTESGKESSEELARESLIALSHSLPDSPKLSTKKLSSGHTFKEINGDEAETHRSKLISISNKLSSDTKARPVSPGANAH